MRTDTLVLRSLLPFFVALLTAAPVSAHKRPVPASAYTAYNGGAWFKIEYPRGWKVTPLTHSTTNGTGYDSARFTSPDGSAEFYVFSPQWNGNPQGILLDPRREILVAHRTSHASHGKLSDGSYISNVVVNWYTARANDNSYQRSWVDTENTALNARLVFGIKYRSAEVYKRYQAEYAHFRESLVQYAD